MDLVVVGMGMRLGRVNGGRVGITYLATAWLALLVEAATEKLLVHRAGVVSLAHTEIVAAVTLPGCVVVAGAAAAIAC